MAAGLWVIWVICFLVHAVIWVIWVICFCVTQMTQKARIWRPGALGLWVIWVILAIVLNRRG